jgi:hypothetical protein
MYIIGNLREKIYMIKKLTSCGGTLNVAVRKSTLMIVSTHGKIKNKPGPAAPPEKQKETLEVFLYKNKFQFDC